jgi:hypothetical protein
MSIESHSLHIYVTSIGPWVQAVDVAGAGADAGRA